MSKDCLQSDQSLLVLFGRSVHEWVAVPLLDEGEARSNASEDAILNCFCPQLLLIPNTTQVIFLNIRLLNGHPSPFDTLPRLIDHLCERLGLPLSLLLKEMHRHNCLNGDSMGLVLIINACLHCLDQLLELGNLMF